MKITIRDLKLEGYEKTNMISEGNEIWQNREETVYWNRRKKEIIARYPREYKVLTGIEPGVLPGRGDPDRPGLGVGWRER